MLLAPTDELSDGPRPRASHGATARAASVVTPRAAALRGLRLTRSRRSRADADAARARSTTVAAVASLAVRLSALDARPRTARALSAPLAVAVPPPPSSPPLPPTGPGRPPPPAPPPPSPPSVDRRSRRRHHRRRHHHRGHPDADRRGGQPAGVPVPPLALGLFALALVVGLLCRAWCCYLAVSPPPPRRRAGGGADREAGFRAPTTAAPPTTATRASALTQQVGLVTVVGAVLFPLSQLVVVVIDQRHLPRVDCNEWNPAQKSGMADCSTTEQTPNGDYDMDACLFSMGRPSLRKPTVARGTRFRRRQRGATRRLRRTSSSAPRELLASPNCRRRRE